MSPRSRVLTVSVLVVLAGCCVAQAGRLAYLHSPWNPNTHGEDWGFPRAEARLAPVRPIVAPERVIGYLNDPPDASPNNARYVIAQHVLAPVVLDAQAPRAVTLIDVDDEGALDRVASANFLVVTRRLGRGLALAQRRLAP